MRRAQVRWRGWRTIDSLSLRPPHGVALLDSKGRMELRHICERPVDAVLIRPVRVEGHHLQRPLLGCILAPHLCPREEEALMRIEPVDVAGRPLRIQLCIQRGESELQPAQISDVLPASKLSVELLTINSEPGGLLHLH